MAEASIGKQAAVAKAQRDRSPAYPFISLKTAFERAAAFEAKFGRHGSPLNKAGLAWGFKGDGSQASQTLSALKYFGLVEYSGPTNERVVALTEDARNYMRSPLPATKSEIAKACALRPKAMQTYWSRWGADRPIDDICLDQLILKDHFTEGAAKIFLRVYDDTVAFAGLGDGDSPALDGGSEEGDTDPVSPTSPSGTLTTMGPTVQLNTPSMSGMRQEVFALTEGYVTIQWPDHLSAESFQDFVDWLRILERKIKRSVIPSTPISSPSEQTKQIEE